MSDYQSYFENGGFNSAGANPVGGNFFNNLLGLGFDSAKAAIGFSFDKKRADYSAKLSEEAARRQYERQLDFWNKQNEYNDPSNVRRRLEEAGLGASALLGGAQVQNIGGSAGPLSSVPGNEVDLRGRYAEVENPFTRMMQLAQLRNIEADSELKKAQAGQTGAQEDLTRNTISLQDSQILLNGSIKALNESYALTEETKRALNESQKSLNDVRESLDRLTLNFESNPDVRQKRLHMFFKSSDMLDKQYDITCQQLEDWLFKNEHLNPAQLDEVNATTSLLRKQAIYYGVQKQLIERNIEASDIEILKAIEDLYYDYGLNPDGTGAVEYDSSTGKYAPFIGNRELNYRQHESDTRFNTSRWSRFWGNASMMTSAVGALLGGAGHFAGGVSSVANSKTRAKEVLDRRIQLNNDINTVTSTVVERFNADGVITGGSRKTVTKKPPLKRLVVK